MLIKKKKKRKKTELHVANINDVVSLSKTILKIVNVNISAKLCTTLVGAHLGSFLLFKTLFHWKTL